MTPMNEMQSLLIDLALAVHLNPVVTPNAAVSAAAARMVKTYTIVGEANSYTIKALSESTMAWNGVQAGLRQLNIT